MSMQIFGYLLDVDSI